MSGSTHRLTASATSPAQFGRCSRNSHLATQSTMSGTFRASFTSCSMRSSRIVRSLQVLEDQHDRPSEARPVNRLSSPRRTSAAVALLLPILTDAQGHGESAASSASSGSTYLAHERAHRSCTCWLGVPRSAPISR